MLTPTVTETRFSLANRRDNFHYLWMVTTFHPARRRWIALSFCLIAIGLISGTLWWWAQPRSKFDVSIKFVEFQTQGGTRQAVFEVENRTDRTLHGIPKSPALFSYQLLGPGNERTYPGKLGGGWYGIPSSKRSKLVVPLVCPDGTPITGPFRVGLNLTDFSGQERRERICKLPGWAAHWIMKGMPTKTITDKTEVYWSETATP